MAAACGSHVANIPGPMEGDPFGDSMKGHLQALGEHLLSEHQRQLQAVKAREMELLAHIEDLKAKLSGHGASAPRKSMAENGRLNPVSAPDERSEPSPEEVGQALESIQDSQESDDDVRIHFEMHPFEDVSHGVAARIEKSLSLSDVLQEEPVYADDDPFLHWKQPWFMFKPGSMKHAVWDLIGVLVLVADAIITPLQIAFPIGTSIIIQASSSVSLIYWTLDIFVCFLTALEDDLGRAIFAPSKIARHYLRTWFVFDATLVSADYLEVVSKSMGDRGAAPIFRLARAVRSLRGLRALRLLRFIKLRRKLDFVFDKLHSDIWHVMLELLSNCFKLLFLNHFIACGWYWIGSGEGVNGWVDKHGFVGKSDPFLYACAYHWSLTQFTPASMDIVPHTFGERIYAVMVLIFAMCIFTSFIASITSRMSLLRNLAVKKEKSIRDLHDYFSRHVIPRELRRRIYVHNSLTSASNRCLDTASVLANLSVPLAIELRYALFDRYLSVHPLFKALDYRSPALIQALCKSAVTPYELSPSDCVFNAGDPATAMYFMSRGKMRYGLRAQGALPQIVTVGDWCSEAALWTTWFHVGKLEAALLSEVLALKSQEFRKIAHGFPALIDDIKDHAQAFVAHLNEKVIPGMPAASCLSDLHHGRASMLSRSTPQVRSLSLGSWCSTFFGCYT